MQRSPEVEAALQRVRTSSDPAELRALVENASEAELAFRPAPGDWSIVEMLRHLGDTEEMRHTRFDRMLAEDNPILGRSAPQPGDRDSDDGRVLVARWERLRTQSLQRLTMLSEEQWHRVATQLPDPQVHRTENAPTSVLIESGKIERHSADHLQQARKNLAAFHTQRLPA
jgi:hypothetical protein